MSGLETFRAYGIELSADSKQAKVGGGPATSSSIPLGEVLFKAGSSSGPHAHLQPRDSATGPAASFLPFLIMLPRRLFDPS